TGMSRTSSEQAEESEEPAPPVEEPAAPEPAALQSPPVEEPVPPAPVPTYKRQQAEDSPTSGGSRPLIPLVILGIIGLMAVGMLIAIFVGI
ncbi:MAG TPA: hypothetical protein VEY88_25725, partial [Archangium sp.]|nr:hypothetical protein [Archangium sp.]